MRSGGQSGLGKPFQLLVLFHFPHPAERGARSHQHFQREVGWWRWQGSSQSEEGQYLCLQRRRNLMIFRAAWSCFLVRKEPLAKKKKRDK